ncbi:membrane protein of unknown function [Agreia sp. COWG]|nr:membrane protein of unknown function [Agreia sp. COWG]
MLVTRFSEKIEKRTHRLDIAGAMLLTSGLTLVILAVLEGGQAWAWNAPQSVGAFVVGGVLLLCFVAVERRAAEPILPLWVFSRRLLVTTTLISLGVGAVLIGLTSYVPTFLEGVTGASPLLAGLALAALTIGWPISASLSGRLYLRFGFRATVLTGSGISLLGAASLVLSYREPQLVLVAASCFLVGLGLGLVATPSLIAAQSSVPWSERGVVTGANLFARSIGSAVGVAIFGAVANAIFAAGDGGEGDPVVLTAASGAVFVAVLVGTAFTLVAALAMPQSRVEDVEHQRADAA